MDPQSGPPSDNLFVSGLPDGLQEADITTVFSAYGTVTDYRLLPGGGTKRNAALVRFASLEEAQWVCESLNGNIPQGLDQPVAVRFATTRGNKGGGGGAMPGPYGAAGKGPAQASSGLGGGKCKGASNCNFNTLVTSLVEASAVPGGRWSNDENALFIGGLPWDTKTEDLYSLFSPFGPIPAKGAKAMLDPSGSACTGIGFVNFMDATDAATAVMALDGTNLSDGKVLEVKIKTPKKGKGGGKDMM